MKKPIQLSLFKKTPRYFGGLYLHGKRRSRRPLSSKDAIHLVMRSSWAKGPFSFLLLKHKKTISAIIHSQAKKYRVRIYELSIVGNHLHFVLKIPDRDSYKSFIRVVSGQIASQVMGSRSFAEFHKRLRGDAPSHPGFKEIQGLEQAFWQFRPFSRVLHWGRDFKTCCAYVKQNTAEAMGFVKYKPRQQKDPFAHWCALIFADDDEVKCAAQ